MRRLTQASLAINLFVIIVCYLISSISIYFAVYTMFALCEYLVVIVNIAFHMTALSDFDEAYITIGPLITSDENLPEKHR